MDATVLLTYPRTLYLSESGWTCHDIDDSGLRERNVDYHNDLRETMGKARSMHFGFRLWTELRLCGALRSWRRSHNSFENECPTRVLSKLSYRGQSPLVRVSSREMVG